MCQWISTYSITAVWITLLRMWYFKYFTATSLSHSSSVLRWRIAVWTMQLPLHKAVESFRWCEWVCFRRVRATGLQNLPSFRMICSFGHFPRDIFEPWNPRQCWNRNSNLQRSECVSEFLCIPKSLIQCVGSTT
jgi:hypothetical protein